MTGWNGNTESRPEECARALRHIRRSIPCDVRNRTGDKGSMRIYLIRHSMTKGNKEKRYIGTTDESLCLEGIQLLEERKGMYPEVTYVYVSPMKRCVQTAEIIYPEMMKAGAYSCNEKLRECDFGLFENHNYIELSGCPEYQAWIDSGGKLPFPEGESREAFIRRTLEGSGKSYGMRRHMTGRRLRLWHMAERS